MLFSVFSFSASAAVSDVLGQETALGKNSALATSSVNDDLKNMGVDLSKYPYKKGAESELFSFYENGDEYYVYIYNPSRMKYDVGSALNKIQMALGWNDEGNASKTSFYILDFISGSGETDTLGHLFLKFRIRIDGKIPSLKVGSGRRYDIVEVELLEKGKYTADAIDASWTYTFLGRGSALRATVEVLRTVEIETHYTYYRNGLDGNGKARQDQINSVYFSVPEEWFDDGKTIVGVTAEWDQYKTKPIIVTDDEECFALLNSYKNRPVFYNPKSANSRYPYDVPFSLQPSFKTEVSTQFSGTVFTTYVYPWLYGVKFENSYPIYYRCGPTYNIYKWAFLSDSTEPGEIAVSREDLESAIFSYCLPTIYDDYFSGDKVFVHYPYKGADLTYFEHDAFLYYDENLGRVVFQEPIYETHGSGYRKKDIWIDETLSSGKYDFGFDFVAAFRNWIGGGTVGEDLRDIVPIVPVDDVLIEAGSEKALVCETDWDGLLEFQKKEESKDRRTYLLRFDISDYVSDSLLVEQHTGEEQKSYGAKWYQETVYLNFDILRFVLMEEGEFRRIRAEGIDVDDYLDENPESGDRVPVVNDPINGIADLINPNVFEFSFLGFSWPDFGGMPEWMENLLVLLRFIFGFVIVFFLLWLFVKFVWPVLVWIGKGIASFFKGASSVTKKGVAKFRSTSLYQKTSSAVKKGTAAIREKRQQSKKKERTKKKK